MIQEGRGDIAQSEIVPTMAIIDKNKKPIQIDLRNVPCIASRLHERDDRHRDNQGKLGV